MGSEKAKAEFVERLESHRGILFKIANAYCRDAGRREDLVAETIAQLWRAYSWYDGRASFPTWMYRISLNVAISLYRSEGRRVRDVVPAESGFIETIPLPEGDRSQEDQLDLLHEAIGRLEPLDRALMILYLDDNSYASIAEILGISETNVATKIGRIKQRLKRDVADSQRIERQTYGTR